MKAKKFKKAINYLKFQEIIENNNDIASTGLISKAGLSKAINGDSKYLTDSFLNRFCTAYPFFNRRWFSEETAEMLVDEKIETKVSAPEPNSMEDLLRRIVELQDELLNEVRKRIELENELNKLRIDFNKVSHEYEGLEKS